MSVDASPQKFHKMNCKVSQQRSGLVSGCFTAKVSQNELQSFAAKVRSFQWRTRHRKSFTKLIAKFHRKGPLLSVDASPLQQRSSNVSVDRDVFLVLEILGQKLFFCRSHCASRVSQTFVRGSLYWGSTACMSVCLTRGTNATNAREHILYCRIRVRELKIIFNHRLRSSCEERAIATN